GHHRTTHRARTEQSRRLPRRCIFGRSPARQAGFLHVVGAHEAVRDATAQREESSVLASGERKWRRSTRSATEGVGLVVVGAAAAVLAARSNLDLRAAAGWDWEEGHGSVAFSAGITVGPCTLRNAEADEIRPE